MRVTLFVTLAAVTLAGCGGGGSAAGSYAQALSAALASVSQPASLDADTLAKLAHDYSDAADRLGRLTPPADVAQSHAQMVASLHAYAVDLAAAATVTSDAAA